MQNHNSRHHIITMLCAHVDQQHPVELHDFPIDLIRFQLLPFFSTRTCVQLTKSSQLLFHKFRHKIRRRVHVTTEHFIQQTRPESKCICVSPSVKTRSTRDLNCLIQHISSQSINKACSLLNLFNAFNEPLGNIVFPASLHSLKFGWWFNHSILGVTLPSTLHTLHFGYCFDRSMIGITFPASLHTLTFGGCFDQTLHGVMLPPHLHTLTFGWHFNQSFSCINIPATLHLLTFGRLFNQSLLGIPFPSDMKIRKEGTLLADDLLPPGIHIVYI